MKQFLKSILEQSKSRKLTVCLVLFLMVGLFMSSQQNSSGLVSHSSASASFASPVGQKNMTPAASITVEPKPTLMPKSAGSCGNNCYWVGAYTGLLSSQEALIGNLEVIPCQCLNSQQYVSGWVAYYEHVFLSACPCYVTYWAQMGWQSYYNDNTPICFAQVWVPLSGTEVYNHACPDSVKFGASYNFKVTTYGTGSNTFYFSIGNIIELWYTLPSGATFAGPDSSWSAPNSAFYEQDNGQWTPTGWGIENSGMSSYLCTPSCSWHNWAQGTAWNDNGYYTLAGHDQYSTIPVDEALINWGGDYTNYVNLWG
jgi:hypothetical protein